VVQIMQGVAPMVRNNPMSRKCMGRGGPCDCCGYRVPEIEALLAVLPKAKYRVVETDEGWEVYGDGDPSFT
jgi:hypothetical protein